MKTFLWVVPMLVSCAPLAGCEQDLEKADFNAYFYYPDQREEFLGLVHGLTACQAAASDRPTSPRMELHLLRADSLIILRD